MHYAIGIDVGGTTIKAGLIGTDARIYHQFSVDTPHGADALVSVMPTIVHTMTQAITSGQVQGLSQESIDSGKLISTIGIDVPGIVNERSGIAEFSANLGWHHFEARERFSHALNRPVAFGHDVRNGALAESFWGVALPHFFYIAIGTGIASVLVVDNSPVSPHPWAGEIGQIPLPDPDRPGEFLPLEQIASASAIARRAREAGLTQGGGANEVYRLADGTLGTGDATLTPDERSSALAQGIIDEAIAALAHGIAPSLAAFGPIPVVLGGGLANEGQALLDHVQSELSRALGIIPCPELHLAQLGSRSQVLGAGLRAFLAEGLVTVERQQA